MFYNGQRLLNKLDLNGEKPELFFCTGNRASGKTTFFMRYLINNYLKYNKKFCILYRFKQQLKNCDAKIFSDVQELFFPSFHFSSSNLCENSIFELLCDGNQCGYAIAINCADTIKLSSHLLHDVDTIFFDEFQSETSHYCNNEILKFLSIHTSIARGGGKMRRYCPVIMCSNTVSLLNPYFAELNILSRLKNDTKILRGNGYVLEQSYISDAEKEISKSGITKAFNKSNYIHYQSQNIYLDNQSLIEKPSGNFRYFCTLKWGNQYFSLRYYNTTNIYYCHRNIDVTYPLKICCRTEDMEEGYMHKNTMPLFINNLRFAFNSGNFRFQDLNCKNAILNMLQY